MSKKDQPVRPNINTNSHIKAIMKARQLATNQENDIPFNNEATIPSTNRLVNDAHPPNLNTQRLAGSGI
jgi:hypothetical protein